MSDHPLQGAFLKVKHAYADLQSLEKLGKDFIDGDPYGIELKRNRQSGKYLALYVGKAKVFRDPPVKQMGTLIGSIARDLRAALDNMVWELSDAESGPVPKGSLPKGSPWRHTAFPIFLTRREFLAKDRRGRPISTSGMGMLWGVRKELIAEFKALQPYRYWHQGLRPARHPLWVLHELSNMDKHRHPPLVGAVVKLNALGFYSATKSEIILRHSGFGPFKDGAEFFRIGVTHNPLPGEPEMNVQPRSGFAVAFAKGPPAYGGLMIQTMQSLYQLVSTILIKFQPEFP